MQVIRRRIRASFALQAILLFVVGITGVIRPAHAHHSATPLRYYAVIAVYFLFSLVFAKAWLTTRKPSPFRRPWAVAASVFSLITGAAILWLSHTTVESATPGLLVFAVGAAGLYFFAQGGPAPGKSASASEAPEPVVAKKKPAPIKGDRTHPWVNYLVTAITLAAESAALLYWARWAHINHLTHRGALPWYILFTFAVLISTIVHECGHAFFAWGCYMKLLSFNAGPLRWQKREGKWSFKFHPAGFVDLGGSVRVIPTNPKQPRVHELWMVFAGPLANILFGLLLLWVLFSLGLPHFDQTWRLVAFTASFCFIAAITNLFPFMTEDGGYSDGARMLQIVTKSPLDDYHRTMNSLAATLVTPQRYRDLDVAALERAAARFPDDIRGLNLLLCVANCYQDSDQLPQARAALAAAEAIYTNHAIDLPARLHRPFVINHAYLNRDAAAARLWWDRMEAKPAEPQNVDYWLAQTALAWIEGRPQEAQEAWQKAEDAAQKLPECGSGDWDRDRCTLLRKQLEAPSPVPVPQPAAPVPTSTPAERIARRTATRTPPIQASIPATAPATGPTSAVAATASTIPSLADPIARRSPAPTPAPAPAEALIPTPEPAPVPAVAAIADPVPVAASIASELPSVFDRIARRPPAPEPAPVEALIATPDRISSEGVILTLNEVMGKDPDASDTATSAENLSPTGSAEPAPKPTPEPTPEPIEDFIPVFASVASNTPFLVDRVPAFRRVPIAEPAPLAEPAPIAEALPIVEAAPVEAPTPAIDWAALIAAAQEAEAQTEAQTEAQIDAVAQIDDSLAANAWATDTASTPIDTSAPATDWAVVTAEVPTEPEAPATWAALTDAAPAASTPPPEPVPAPAPPPKPVETTRYDPLKHIREAHALQQTG